MLYERVFVLNLHLKHLVSYKYENVLVSGRGSYEKVWKLRGIV